MTTRTRILSVLLLALVVGCDSPSPVIPTPVPPGGGGPPVFVGAGDIAQCHTGHSEGTAKLLDSIPGTVFTLGDNAYFTGSREDYRNCYGPTWGRHRARTRPVPGNHEYESPGAIPYFEYYGQAAGPFGTGFYSFEIGPWHLIALNSNIDVGESSEQVRWLREDLRASRARCTLAYWHHPLFSSGPNGNMRPMQTIWRVLQEESADVVLTAHDHLYERFAPQDADGRPDPQRGLRSFVVGTGGATLSPFFRALPNSEVRLSTYGVLKLTLTADRFEWEFITVDSGTLDSGTVPCH
jgi:hypothetical protein